MSEGLWKVPESWTWTKLDVVADWASGGTPKSTEAKFYNGTIPWLIIGDLTDGIVTNSAKRITPLGLENSSVKIVKKGAILIAMYGSIGKLGIAGIECSTNQAIAFTEKIQSEVESQYLFYYLLRARTELNEIGKGGTQQNISQTVLKEFPICLAPLNEQRRIVATLEMLLRRVDAAQERLASIPRILKRFRESVLAAACSGPLTADWRAENRNPEPYPVEAEPHSENGQDYPSNWRVTRLGRLTELVTSGSRGWAKYYSDSGSIFIRAQNINADILNLEDIAFVKLPGRAEGLRTKVRQYDLLVTITGANVTKSALVEKSIEDAYVSQHVALVRLADSRLSKFLFCSVISPSHGRKQLQTAAYGQGKPGLNLDNIRDLVVVLPPLAEQEEIVRRVEALFKTADALETRYRTAKAHVDKLTQSILAKAFRGELVPQDPNDEPASVLLERIRPQLVTNERSNSKNGRRRALSRRTIPTRRKT